MSKVLRDAIFWIFAVERNNPFECDFFALRKQRFVLFSNLEIWMG
jgi:hypothetical protein